MNEQIALGVMSGSSLDGLDICGCKYIKTANGWEFEFVAGETIPFENSLKHHLQDAREMSALELARLDVDLGSWIGKKCREFMSAYSLLPDIIGCHGHTIFHDPSRGLTCQIGDGHFVAKFSGVRVCSDFRTRDVAHGGQGAPLAPIGDVLLFKDFDACINLGGIANITVKTDRHTLAFDICACNQVLNHLAQRKGQDFDKGGQMASGGSLLNEWLERLANEKYYSRSPPKSLGNEWVTERIIDMLPEGSPEDLLFTYCHFIARHLAEEVRHYDLHKVLVTGGGAYNAFLINLLRKKTEDQTLVIPEPNIVDFKEAIVFGLMAVLNKAGEINTLGAMTGSNRDLVSGVVFQP